MEQTLLVNNYVRQSEFAWMDNQIWENFTAEQLEKKLNSVVEEQEIPPQVMTNKEMNERFPQCEECDFGSHFFLCPKCGSIKDQSQHRYICGMLYGYFIQNDCWMRYKTDKEIAEDRIRNTLHYE